MDSDKSFIEWFTNPIQNHYADFEGRVGRQEYWMFVLVWVLASIGLGLLSQVGGGLVEFIHTIITLAILLPSIALAARRLHDTGKTGWWQIVGLVPFLGWVILIILLAQEGEKEANQFGPAVGTPATTGDTTVPPTDNTDPQTDTSSENENQ